jgi:tRNA dimethylallyltransferase
VSGRRRAVLIAGPTASGKSALALELVLREGGIIINADAMQVYDTLRLLTARPGPDETSSAPHMLYGTVPAATRFSTGQWLAEVRTIVEQHEGAAPLVFVGGTGLYFDAMLNGLAQVPQVAPEVISQVQQEVEGLDAVQRMALLLQEDPGTATRLGVADPQRLTRALAVKRMTGRPLSAFQAEPEQGLLNSFVVERIILDVDRDVLRRRIAERLETMFDAGAQEEVRSLRGLDLDPSLPVMKAIGVREIGAYLDGLISREEAIARATTATHQYAKRQRTWFRNRFGDWPRRPA